MIKSIRISLGILTLILMATGCDVLNPPPVMSDATAHVLTLYAVLTDSAAGLNQPPAAATVSLPTVVLTSTQIPTSGQSATAQLPSVTPLSTNLATPCYRAGFVADVTIPDDYNKLAPGETFTKTWRLRNDGTCNWPATLLIVFVSGERMDGPETQAIGQAVNVGQTVDISVTLKAPTTAGKHRGDWMLRTPDGNRFGLGTAGNDTFWVQIFIGSLTQTVTLTPTVGTPLPTRTPTVTPTITQTSTPAPSQTPTITQTPPCPPYPEGMDHCP